MTFTTDEPELIVRLYQGEKDGAEDVSAVFEVCQFEERLHHMREIYENEMLKNNQGKTPRDKTDPHPTFSWIQNPYARHADPWATYTYRGVQHEVEQMQLEITDLR